MKQYNGFESKENKGAQQLPAGGYVCKIIGAEVESFKTKDGGTLEKLKVTFDIYEGEYSEYFDQLYKSSQFDDAKYKGNYRIAVPDESSPYVAGQKRTFNNFIWAVESSNPGYRWDWNESGLAGKYIGIIFRNREWEYNGKTGWTTEAWGSTSVDNIREGKYTTPKDKPLQKASQGGPEQYNAVPDDEPLPF